MTFSVFSSSLIEFETDDYGLTFHMEVWINQEFNGTFNPIDFFFRLHLWRLKKLSNPCFGTLCNYLKAADYGCCTNAADVCKYSKNFPASDMTPSQQTASHGHHFSPMFIVTAPLLVPVYSYAWTARNTKLVYFMFQGNKENVKFSQVGIYKSHDWSS